jgi:hypothetical protein
MKTTQFIILFSQVLEVCGAYLLFKYSLPPYLNKFSIPMAPDISKAPDIKKQDIDNNKYAKLTKLGFLLVLIGFAINFIISINNFIDCN